MDNAMNNTVVTVDSRGADFATATVVAGGREYSVTATVTEAGWSILSIVPAEDGRGVKPYAMRRTHRAYAPITAAVKEKANDHA